MLTLFLLITILSLVITVKIIIGFTKLSLKLLLGCAEAILIIGLFILIL